MRAASWRAALAAIVMTTLWVTGAAVLLGTAPAWAQAESAEARLREALRRVTVDLRAAQDSQAALQAQFDQMTQQRDELQQQLKAQPAAAPAAPPPPDPELAQLRAEVRAQQEAIKVLQADGQKWRTAYQQAADMTRARDAESQQRGRSLQVSDARLGLCAAENAKLVTAANDILHLYRNQDFRTLLVGSYEPLLGLKKVELENMVQDYEDRILAQKYYGNEALQPAAGASTPAAKPVQ